MQFNSFMTLPSLYNVRGILTHIFIHISMYIKDFFLAALATCLSPAAGKKIRNYIQYIFALGNSWSCISFMEINILATYVNFARVKACGSLPKIIAIKPIIVLIFVFIKN